MLSRFCARYLRSILWLDAFTCLGFGLACLVFAAPISALTDVPARWLVGGGAICLLAAMLIVFAVTRREISPPLVMTISAINLIWALASFLCVALGWIEPNMIGKIAVIGQGIIVLAVADAQYLGAKARARLVLA
ncbi:MAG: hypothetical protein LCH38_12085 [Proteobacteria bacterium]|nr:hypothetical protein [Pseudomonadota bacterium]